MYKIGMSSCGFALNEDNFRLLSESKIATVEVSMSYEKCKDINYKEIKIFSDRYGVDLWSYHLPFWPFEILEISAFDKTVRDNTLSYFSELIKKASDIGIDKFIVHPSGEPISDGEREDRIKYSMQSLDRLAEIAYGCGSVIAVEDLPRTCLGNTSDDILRLISANDKLRVCFDTNHLLSEDNIDFMKKVGDKIITVHISDYDLVDEKHWLPGEGKLDWKKMLATFKDIGYNGVWMYEIGLKCPRTLTRDRDLTFYDFYSNAQTIFEGKDPNPIGRPNLEL